MYASRWMSRKPKALPPLVLVVVLAVALGACGGGKPSVARSTTTSATTSGSATTTTSLPTTTVVAPTTSTSLQRGTRIAYAAPVDTLGRPAGLTVSAQVAGTCGSGSDSVGGVEVYRCFSGNLIYDPCWDDTAGGVLCMESPWATTVVHLLAPGIPPGVDVTTEDLDYPWGVELTSGARCLALQGAHDSFAGKTVDFGCTGGTVSGLSLLRPVKRTAAYWTYETVIYSGANKHAGPQVTVTTAWFAGPTAGSASSCNGQAVAVTSTAPTPTTGMAWLVFENRSVSSCRLVGYPGVAVLGAAGNQVSQVARSPAVQGSPAAVVVIPPGGTAAAELNGDPDYPNGTCPSYRELLVTPPNTTASRKVTVNNLVICADAQISPVGAEGGPFS